MVGNIEFKTDAKLHIKGEHGGDMIVHWEVGSNLLNLSSGANHVRITPRMLLELAEAAPKIAESAKPQPFSGCSYEP